MSENMLCKYAEKYEKDNEKVYLCNKNPCPYGRTVGKEIVECGIIDHSICKKPFLENIVTDAFENLTKN